jgi:nitrogenase molybdenum-iron protein beta chain
MNAIIDQYTDRFACHDAPKDPKRVNLFASIPDQAPFSNGNLEELKRLLEGIGLKAQVLFGPRTEGIAEWKGIPQANFNILVSPWYGLDIVIPFYTKNTVSPGFSFPIFLLAGIRPAVSCGNWRLLPMSRGQTWHCQQVKG